MVNIQNVPVDATMEPEFHYRQSHIRDNGNRNRTLLTGMVVIGLAATPVQALTINDSFNSPIQNNSNAAAIEAVIQTASNQIASAFSNDATINILFGTFGGGGGLSQQFLIQLHTRRIRICSRTMLRVTRQIRHWGRRSPISVWERCQRRIANLLYNRSTESSWHLAGLFNTRW